MNLFDASKLGGLLKYFGAVFCLLLATILIDLGIPSIGLYPEAEAQKEETKKDQRPTRRTPALRNKVYEKLAEAQVAAEEKDYITAKVVLDGMLAEDGKKALNSYELANVYNLYAFLEYAQEDYPGALRYYEKVIEQPEIPLAMEINTRFTVAQLYFIQEQWQSGIDALLLWFDLTDKPNANIISRNKRGLTETILYFLLAYKAFFV